MSPEHENDTRTAIITGASAGLGRALARRLAGDGWRLIIDGRRDAPLESVRAELAELTPRANVIAISGDVSDPAHRDRLVASAGGRLDLLINNASELGPSPLLPLRDLPPAVLDRLWSVNVAAPMRLLQAALPLLGPAAAVINISSDAAAEHYESWGGYGATKAALDHLTLTLAAEEPGHRFYAVDPGDMRTAMHQAAFPGEDISDRPEPEEIVPALIALVDSTLPSGRYRATDLPVLEGSLR